MLVVIKNSKEAHKTNGVWFYEYIRDELKNVNKYVINNDSAD